MSFRKHIGIVAARERFARMKKLLIGALLVLPTIGGTIALATPQAQAATPAATTLRDRQGDAPARIDLTKIVVQRQSTKLLVRVHLRDAPRGNNQGYKIWLDSDRTPEKAPDYTMRWISQEYGSGRTSGWDVVTSPWNPYGVGHANLTINPRPDYFTFSVPMSDLKGTRSVRVAASSYTMDTRGRRKSVDHLTARHKFSHWVPVASI